MDDFIKASQLLGKNLLYVQGAGGNASVKLRDKMYVKASGYLMKDIAHKKGYACCYYKSIASFIKSKKRLSKTDEENFLSFVATQLVLAETYGMPSMEIGFHTIIPSKYVFHLHSVYANVFGCMKYGSHILSKLCKTFPHLVIDYKNPGYELAYYLSKKDLLPEIIFLKNHGIIVHGQKTESCLAVISEIHKILENYIKDKNAFTPFELSDKYIPMKKYSFPDSAVFAKIDASKISEKKHTELLEIFSAQQYIKNTIKRLDKKPAYLSKIEVNTLLQMKQEKHRQQLFTK